MLFMKQVKCWTYFGSKSKKMKYKVQDNCIEGYQGNVLVSLLYITDPVARAKYILQLHNSGELSQ